MKECKKWWIHFRIKNYNPVNSTPVAADIGGKRNFTKKLSKLLRTFFIASKISLFVSMGGIFFELKLILSPEINNNLSGYGVNFWGMLQHHYRPFMKNVSISDKQLWGVSTFNTASSRNSHGFRMGFKIFIFTAIKFLRESKSYDERWNPS